MTVAPLADNETEVLQHTGHYLMEKLGGGVVELVAIGGAWSGKKIRRFASRDELDVWAKQHGITYRTREGT